jgi:hypothetical protein
MPTAADPLVDLPQVAFEFFEYIVHLSDIQEPDCYVADMTEKELREKVSKERTQYGVFDPKYIHTELASEDFVSIGEMSHEEPDDSEEYHEIVVDNSWNVVNNQVLNNSLQYDTNISSKIKAIASLNAKTKPTKIPLREIDIAIEAIKEKKYFSFTEANKAGADTSHFNVGTSIPLDQRYATTR